MLIRVQHIARTKYKTTKALLIIGIIFLLLLSAFIGLVAYFGQYMGTFVIGLDYYSKTLGIQLSQTSDFENPTTTLLVNPVNEGVPASFGVIDWAGTIAKDGDYDSSDKNNYIAYTFYLRNEGTIAVDIALNLNVAQIINSIDDSVRVAIIEDGSIGEDGLIQFKDARLYMKEDIRVDKEGNTYEVNPDEVTVNYLDYSYVNSQLGADIYDEDAIKNFYYSFDIYTWSGKDYFGDYTLENFKPGEVRKFSLFVWIEGWDKDCNDKILNGRLKMNLEFAIKQETDEDIVYEENE